MRIAIAGIIHETNTYCRDQTTTVDFHQSRGERIFKSRGTETSIGGALAICAELGIEVVPLLVVSAQPSGIVELETYQAFKAEILQGLAPQLPIVGIFLDLHGAGVVDGIHDLEGDLVQAIRDLAGPSTGIVATFDLHGNITAAMVEALDGTFACHQYPHIDLHWRAREAIKLIRRMATENLKPVSYVEKLPMLMPTTTTFSGIGKAHLAIMLAAEEEPGSLMLAGFTVSPTPRLRTLASISWSPPTATANRRRGLPRVWPPTCGPPEKIFALKTCRLPRQSPRPWRAKHISW